MVHAFHHALEVVRGNYPKIDLLISSVKVVFLRVTSRVNIYMYPDIPLPKANFKWMEAAEYYVKPIHSINNILLVLSRQDGFSIDTAFCERNVKYDLIYIQQTFSFIIITLESLQNRHLSLFESF